MPKQIQFVADYQLDWPKLVRRLRPHKIEDPLKRSISGEAPKDFVLEQSRNGHRRPKNWVGYIAKIGSKHYPIESITEHLITRLGQLCGLRIANSKLAIVNCQLRFMSQYFLRDGLESLVHGAEIFEPILSKDIVREIADKKGEREFYTFQMVEEAVTNSFPEYSSEIMDEFVRMLIFDALIGNQDRHFFNWAIITPIKKDSPPQFSPIYDTARALFWDMEEPRIKTLLSNQAQLDGYINRGHPMLGWDKKGKIKHFELARLIWEQYPCYRKCFESALPPSFPKGSRVLIDREFRHLMSSERRELIKRCLSIRHQTLREQCLDANVQGGDKRC